MGGCMEKKALNAKNNNEDSPTLNRNRSLTLTPLNDSHKPDLHKTTELNTVPA